MYDPATGMFLSLARSSARPANAANTLAGGVV